MILYYFIFMCDNVFIPFSLSLSLSIYLSIYLYLLLLPRVFLGDASPVGNFFFFALILYLHENILVVESC